MEHNEFLTFLKKIDEAKSFTAKIKTADVQLTRIGSGSGRVVYDIDGAKALKLAKNPKGQAQNKVERNTGVYYDTENVVAIVYDSADDNSWIISEKAKKVTENRIKELTGIPSLSIFHTYLSRIIDLNNGKKPSFFLEPAVIEELNENEFTVNMLDFVIGYKQLIGDMQRPSTFGEVLRDGEPTIILTDYGLNDEVYQTYYNPKRKQRMYELYNFYDGNDDILSDIGNTEEVRYGMWAQMPYGVGDGDGVINEEFINFVSKRDKYPSKPLKSMSIIIDSFHECVNNLKEVMNNVKDKKHFYENLLKLQEYLISQKAYDRDPLGEVINKLHRVGIDEDGTALYSADDAIGQDDFPVHNNMDSSPSIQNDLNANSVMYERELSSMEGSSTVTVKDKCKLGGLGNTSEPCNQGDISNLNIKPLDETSVKTADRIELYRDSDYVVVVPLTHTAAMKYGCDTNWCTSTSNQQFFDWHYGDNKFFIYIINRHVKPPPLQKRNDKINNFVGLYNDNKWDDLEPDEKIKYLDYSRIAISAECNDGYLDIKMWDANDFDIDEFTNDYNPVNSLPIPENIKNIIDKYITENINCEEDNSELNEVSDNNTPNQCTPIKVIPELEEFVLGFDADEKLLRSGGVPIDILDILAFGFSEEMVNRMSPKHLSIKWKDDLENVKHEIKNKGLNDIDYAKSVDLSEPIDVSYDGKKFYIEDGHHRYYAAKVLNKPLNIKLEITANPITKLGYDDYDDFHRCLWKQIHNKPTDLNEVIEASEAYTDDGALQTVIDGKRNVGLYVTYFKPERIKRLKDSGLNTIPVKQDHHNVDMKIIYSDAGLVDAKKLYDYMVSKGGYVSDDTPEEAMYIGKLLDYSDNSIADYIGRNYYDGVRNKFEEGVADKYAEKEFYMKPEFDDFNQKERGIASREAGDEIVYNNGRTKLIKNPKSINSLGSDVRGIIDTEGNLYIEQEQVRVHSDLIDVLVELGKIKGQSRWHRHAPINFVTVQRLGNSNKILLGESNEPMYLSNEWGFDDIPARKEVVDKFEEFLIKAKQKNPNIDFINEVIIDYINKNHIEEGVADKYAEKEFNTPNPDNDFNRKYASTVQADSDKPIGVEKLTKTPIYKNPKSLDNFESNVRAIVDINGDLYVALNNADFYHSDLARGIGIGNENVYDDLNRFVLMHRYRNTNIFGLSISSCSGLDNGSNEVRNKLMSENRNMLHKAKQKNPQYEFYLIYHNALGGMTDPEDNKYKITEDLEIEGVADKYAEKEFYMKPEFDDFNQKERDIRSKADSNIVVYNKGNVKIVKNPKSLTNISAGVRGVIDKEGNLYIEQKRSGEVHVTILRILEDLGILKYNHGWTEELPRDFITVMRLEDENVLMLGESNETMTPNEYRSNEDYGENYWDDIPAVEKAAPYFQQFLDKAKIKNPNINFINKNIGYSDIEEGVKEGVADKYAEKEFHMKPEFDDFDQKEKDIQVRKAGDEVVYNERGLKLIKNPKSINSLGSDVRGVIDTEGNLYMEQVGNKIHVDLIDALVDLNLINDDDYWHVRAPRNFLTVQRLDDENLILIGESNRPMLPDSVRVYGDWRDIPKREDVYYKYQEFLDKAKRKNPNINFVNEKIDVYIGNDYNVFDKNIGIDGNLTTFANSNNKEIMNEAELMSLQDLPFKQDVENQGGKIYSVGGAVRDEFLGKESKDLDILITGISLEDLEIMLSKYGKVDAVGKSFGILKFKPEGSTEDIDVAIPRTENMKDGGGHKGFEVTSDPTLPIEDDLIRRDFTINAIAKDIDGNLIDPYGGQEDLKNKIIRAVNPNAFGDDPLRMLRAVQFSTRFRFTIEPNTMKMIQQNASRIKEIPPERVLTELDKIVQKGNPTIGAQLLIETGLFQQIFGRPKKISSLFNNVKTMGEFIYLLSVGVVENPAEFYRDNLKGDINTYKEIKALTLAFENNNNLTPVASRSIGHNMYLISPNSLNSGIIPDEIKNAGQELLTGRYPKTNEELTVNGNDLVKLGLKGIEIGNAKKRMLINIYSDKVLNNKNDLLALINTVETVEEGVADKYAEKEFNIADPNNEFDKKYAALNQLEDEEPFGYVQETPVYKNPRTLSNFDMYVRAIADINGDLYVAVIDNNFVHGDMAYELGLTDNDVDIYRMGEKYALLHRYRGSNSFGLSDSTSAMINREETNNSSKSLSERKTDVYNILHKTKQKNPQYDFYLNYYYDIGRGNDDFPNVIVNEEMKKSSDVSYTAIVLDDESRKRLIKVFSKMIPEGWEVLAHHMTLNMGEVNPEQRKDLGKKVIINAVKYAINDNVMAVGVKGYDTDKDRAHITLAVNRANGGKPKMSDELTNWRAMGFSVKLSGVVTEVKNSF